MGSGSDANYWNSGNEGVRITVVRASAMLGDDTIDYTNLTPPSNKYLSAKFRNS
jgi:hypothetical protein